VNTTEIQTIQHNGMIDGVKGCREILQIEDLLALMRWSLRFTIRYTRA